MIEIVIGAALSAILAGALGYTVAVVKRDTAIALLERGHVEINGRLAAQDAKLVAQNEKIDKHLRVMIRIIVDFARHSGVQLRTADVLEIASLTEGENN